MFINGKNEIYVFVWCVFVAVSQYTVCLLNIRIKNIQYFFTYIHNLQNRVHYFFFPIRDFFRPVLFFFAFFAFINNFCLRYKSFISRHWSCWLLFFFLFFNSIYNFYKIKKNVYKIFIFIKMLKKRQKKHIKSPKKGNNYNSI